MQVLQIYQLIFMFIVIIFFFYRQFQLIKYTWVGCSVASDGRAGVLAVDEMVDRGQG